MFKLAFVVLAFAFAVSATPKPVVVAPAVVTAQSSQYIARNYNALVAPVVAQPIAPVVAEPVVAKTSAYVAGPLVARTAAYVTNPVYANHATYVAQHVLPQTAAYFAQPVVARTSAFVADPLVTKTAALVAEPILAKTAPVFHPSAAYFAQTSQPALAKTAAIFPESTAEKTAAPNAKSSAPVENNPAAETFDPITRSAPKDEKEADSESNKQVDVDTVANILAPSVLAARYANTPAVSYYNPYFAVPYGSETVVV